MSFPKKVSLPTAVDSRTNFPLNPQHVTTSNFMELNVAYAMELVPNEQVKIQHSLFTRLEPMSVPTFGRASISNRCFFVPYRTIWPAWNDFISDTPNTSSATIQIPASVPLIAGNTFYTFFQRSECSSVTTSDAYDFMAGGDKYVLTPFGRWCLKVLTGLGYKFVMALNTHSYSCLPLFAFARVFIDWYYPSQYASDSNYLFVSALLDTSFFVSSLGISDDVQLSKIMNLMYNVSYEADYFTSAWDNPFSPNRGLSSRYEIGGIGDSTSYVNNVNDDGTPIMYSVSDMGTSSFSQYDLDNLKSLTDYMKRNQIAGSRALDRYLARFGVKLSSEKLRRSVLIDSFRQPIQFGDVTSTASTETADLGAYAGKGLSYGDGIYNVDSNGEYGMVVILSNIVPDTQYYQGLNRHTLHMYRTDFWTPEYDGNGTQAISSSEIYMPFKAPSAWPNAGINGIINQVYGFTGKYAEYKTAQSLLSGDYALDSRNVGKDSWNLFRDVSSYFDDDISAVHHDYDIVVAKDKQQYDRIFVNVDDNADKFNVIHDFNIDVSFPGRSLFDTYEFENEDDAKHVAVDTGGTTLN